MNMSGATGKVDHSPSQGKKSCNKHNWMDSKSIESAINNLFTQAKDQVSIQAANGHESRC